MRASPIFDNVAVAVAVASKASRTISIVDDSTFPSSIANSKACMFLGFRRYGDNNGSPKLHDSFFGDMAMVVVAAIIRDLELGFD